MTRVFLLCAFALTWATPAFADIPVDDAQQLTQKLQTSATTTTLVPVQQKHRDGQKRHRLRDAYRPAGRDAE